MRQYPCTMLLLASLVILFGVEMSFGAVGNDARLLALGALPASGAIGAEYWRLLSHAWLHAGYAHLAANAALLWFVGRIVERRTGSLATLGVYLGCALAGGVLITWRASIHPCASASLGASAAIFGLLGCALILLHRPSTAAFGRPLWVRGTLFAVLVGGLGISFLPGVSFVGHIGGLVLGSALGFFVPVRGTRGGVDPGR